MTTPFQPVSIEELTLDRFLEMPYVSSSGSEHPHVSASSIKTFLRCPETFRRRYVLGEKEPPAAALLWGGADHATFEVNFKEKLVTGRDMTIAEIKELFAVELDKRVDESGGASQVSWNDAESEDLPDGSALAHAAVKDRGVALVQRYHEAVSPRLTPTAVERPFSVEVPGIPVRVEGRIDLEGTMADPFHVGPLPERIIERKTSGRNALSGEWMVQAFVMQLERALPVDFHLSLKMKVPRVAADEHRVGVPPQAMRVAMVRRALVDMATSFITYGADEPWQHALAHPWSCGYCGFRNSCSWWEWERWQA